MISIIILLLWIIQIKSDKASQVIEFAKSKIGCGYVWGAVGEILTPEKLKYFVGRHPEHVNPDIVKKWMGMQVFDCAGLVHASFATVGIELNKGATSIWGQKNYLKKLEKLIHCQLIKFAFYLEKIKMIKLKWHILVYMF